MGHVPPLWVGPVSLPWDWSHLCGTCPSVACQCVRACVCVAVTFARVQLTPRLAQQCFSFGTPTSTAQLMLDSDL